MLLPPVIQTNRGLVGNKHGLTQPLIGFVIGGDWGSRLTEVLIFPPSIASPHFNRKFSRISKRLEIGLGRGSADRHRD